MVEVIKSILISICGTYTPVTYTSYLSDGTSVEVIPNGLAGVDFPWIIAGVLIVICLYGLIRIIGGVIHNV